MSAGTQIVTLLLGALLSASAAEVPAANSSTVSAPKSNTPPHWAFQSPLRPPIPSVTNRHWVRTPIDAFIARQHDRHGLSPQPEARKEVLLRRVYIDLIGLPPGRDELLHFLADPSPDAYERIVERLLDSRQYGERWGRHWMDVWRYADWFGRRHVPDVWNSAPQVWRWRNWIIDSLNEDKGYDRMILEMLAADEVAPEDFESRAATGYLVRNWYALNPNQWMRDLVEHTGKAFLGLTFNCAHCHDHKYDPISLREYFQFRAFFEPIQVRQDWVMGETDPGRFQKYEYSALRKPVTNGMVSVFDENLEAKTFLYLRGDERTFPEGKPTVTPAMPAFLHGDSVQAQGLDLPASVQYPGLKPFIREAETRRRDQELARALEQCARARQTYSDARATFAAAELAATNPPPERAKLFAQLLHAEATLRTRSNQVAVAQADLDALRARIAADDARYAARSDSGQPATQAPTVSTLAETASRSERMLAWRKAELALTEAENSLALLQAEQSIHEVRKSPGHKETLPGDELKKARERQAETSKSRDAALAATLTNSLHYTPLTPTYPARSSGRRRALGEWIVRRDNPLTARIAVNHMWLRHFHAPLVASVYDFGRNGAKPSHPELLDWLAVELQDHGWGMKHLHRLIVTSSTYRQASHPPAQADGDVSARLDPENRYLWRMNAGQMEAEVVRDSLLHLAGELDLTPGAYPLPNSEADKLRRRTIYFECFPEPGGQNALAELFDPPEPAECYRRTKTVVPQQALALSNSKLSNDQSRALARRLTLSPVGERDGVRGSGSWEDEKAFVVAAYEQVLTRQPTALELAACREFLRSPPAMNPAPASIPGASEPLPESVAMDPATARGRLVHVLFNHNDFLTIR